MHLADFILTNLEPILVEWEAFAKSLPAGASMTSRALRNDAERMLRFIAADLATGQTVDEEIAKSHGRGEHLPEGEQSAAHDHGLQRLEEGFDLIQMVSEYRALRASVTRLWAKEVNAFDQQALEMIRFNEAMDQILAESVERFTEKVGRDKDLFLAVLGHDLRNPLSAINFPPAQIAWGKWCTTCWTSRALDSARGSRSRQRGVTYARSVTTLQKRCARPIRTGSFRSRVTEIALASGMHPASSSLSRIS